MREIQIGGNTINDDNDCFVIAEVGHNHQGDVEKCKQIFLKAKECGADAVKLQKRNNKKLFTAQLYDSPYDNENSFGDTYGQHREYLEFGQEQYKELQKFCRDIGIIFFATAFDFDSADFLARLDMPAFKIASGDLKSIPLIKHIGEFGKPMIISTGGGTMEDIKRVHDAVKPINPQFCFLHCVASYPNQPEEMNLKAITTLRESFPDVVIGLSDHYNGIVMASVAYVLGARIVEKHFTLNHSWKGTDHALSLEPIGMQKMIRDLRRIRISLGDGVKRLLPSEEKPIFKMGKALYASRALPAGHRLTHEDIAIKSPAKGLPPYELDNLVGKELKHDMKEDDAIGFEDLSA
jgi:N-acetylneuraminate synthase/sialic acid synthase